MISRQCSWTVDGMPVYYYGGDFNDSDCEDPRDLEEKCRTNTFAVPHLILSDLSAEMGPMDIEGLPICTQDTRITISDGRWGDDLLCLPIFSGPGIAVNLPVVGRPDWRGLTHWGGGGGGGLSGTQALLVYLAYACVMTVSI